jgi:hypothetical protein
VAVAQGSHKNAADGVKIAFPIRIPIIEALRPIDDERILEKGGGRLIIEKGSVEQVNLMVG